MTYSNNNHEAKWLKNIAMAVINTKAIIFLMTLAIVAISAWGVKDLQVSTNYRVFFGEGNQDLAAFENFEATYTRNDNFLFAVQSKSGDPISRRTLQAVSLMTEQAWQIPFASRVDSLTNFQHTWSDADDLIVEDLFGDLQAMSDGEISRRLEIAASEPLLIDKLINPQTNTAGLNVTLQYSGEDMQEVITATESARELKALIESSYPELRVALSGVSALNNAFAESTIADALTLFPIMFVILTLVIWLSIRSVAGTIGALLVVTFSTLAAMGFAGYFGIALSPFSGSAPVVILTLALADCMHIFVSIKALRQKGANHRDAIIEAYQENFVAVSVTSLTTIVGFLALNFSDAPPFNDLGNIVAVGIFFAWLLSLSFFPAILSVLPATSADQSFMDKAFNRKLGFIERIIRRYFAPILAGSAVMLVVLTGFIFKTDLNDPWVDYFDEKVEFREDTEFVMDNLTGLYLVEISVPAADVEGINDPAYLQKLEQFSNWLRARADVSHVQSYSDIIKRINRNMHSDNDDFYRIPDSKEEASQYLLLYELSLPYGLDMNDRINIDRSASRVTVTLPEISTTGIKRFVDEAGTWMRGQTDTNLKNDVIITGAPVLFSRISERNINDMFGGNLVAVLLIASIISIALSSIRSGFISLLPNIVPILITFGLWAIFVGEVGMAAATVSATSLGIIVDNTVHLLTKYRYAQINKGMDGPDAVNYALKTVGHAVLVNTVILVAGFGVLALSTFRVTGQMGSLTGLVILIALIVDLFMLPSLLLYLDQRKSNRKVTNYEYA